MNNIITTIAVIISLICAGGTACYALILRKKLSHFTDDICDAIDNMISGADYSEMNLQESLFSRINHKLTRVGTIMQENKRQIEKEKRELQELVSDISHQVKTPIANLKMLNATLGRSEIPKEKQGELLKSSDAQLEKLDFLMQSMVKTSRLETGVIALNPAASPIYDTIATALGGIFLMAEKKKITVNVDCDEGILVYHDKKWTAEAIFNVLDNGVKYTPQCGHISVTVEKWEMYTKIDIADNGKGIPEDHHAKIWRRFYREEDAAQIEGIGIGLYLARTIITMQNGYMKVYSELSKGSVFSIFLPNIK